MRLVRRDEDDPISAVIAASDMPTFISDRTTSFTLPENRVAIPLSDDEMNVTFYAVCRHFTPTSFNHALTSAFALPARRVDAHGRKHLQEARRHLGSRGRKRA